MPRAPRQCARSGCLHHVPCPEHQRERPQPAWSGAGRGSTRAWRKLRAQVLAEEPVCRCGAKAAEAGHIIARADGGRDVRENLCGQCAPCNRAQNHRDRRSHLP